MLVAFLSLGGLGSPLGGAMRPGIRRAQVPFKDLSEVKRSKAAGLIVRECHPGDEPLSGALSKILCSLCIQPILYNLDWVPCGTLHKYLNEFKADLERILYHKFKSAVMYLPPRMNLARFIRNHLCNMETGKGYLPEPKVVSWPSITQFKCDLKQIAFSYSEKLIQGASFSGP